LRLAAYDFFFFFYSRLQHFCLFRGGGGALYSHDVHCRTGDSEFHKFTYGGILSHTHILTHTPPPPPKRYRRVLAGRNDLHGNHDNEDSVATTNNMAWLLAKMGRNDEAEPLFARVLECRTATQGPHHPGTLNAMQNLGETRMHLGHHADAAMLLEKVVAGKLENVGIGNISTLKSIVLLAECQCLLGDDAAARAWAARVMNVSGVAPRGVVDRLRKLGLVSTSAVS
jgi:hypothetical protein